MAANPRYANGHRRRELRKRVLAEENTCGICGQPVDKTLTTGPDGKRHPLSPEVDEIVPVSRGGSPTERSNTRLTHRVCNQKRGDGRRERASAPSPVVVASPIW